MLKSPKKPISKNYNIFEKYLMGGPLEKKFFSFLFNTEFYYGISKETIRMPFRGLAMLKSTKLITKEGLCYGFAMVYTMYPVHAAPYSRLLTRKF